ncbi:hypothetical protein [Polaribacter sp.]|uniref:hypothetical protein n=1 Tax=Polaribacter sp. TaxID=1920175 RepID=UPI003F6CC01B
MKLVRIMLMCFILLLNFSCITNETITNSNQIDFKIGKQGFENKIAKFFTFKDLLFGTYTTTKNSISQKGVELTFKMDSVALMSNQMIKKYAGIIEQEVKANLLHLSDYDFVNITFMQEYEKEGITRLSSLKLKRLLN